jgi:hypothetical protein
VCSIGIHTFHSSGDVMDEMNVLEQLFGPGNPNEELDPMSEGEEEGAQVLQEFIVVVVVVVVVKFF